MTSEDKVALVIGASRGIGLCSALALARAGANVVVAARSEDDIRLLARDIEKLGRKALAVKADVSVKADIENAVQQTMQRFGKIDILVYSSAVISIEKLADSTDENFDRTMMVNVKGAYLTIKEVLNKGGMLHSKSGRIILIGSDNSKIGGLGMGIYTASKHALLGLVRCVALEVGPLGITVNAVCPGFVWTKMAQDIAPDVGRLYGVTDVAGLKDWIKEFDPLKRIAQPEEVADVVTFLATNPGAGALTGQGIMMASAVMS